MAEVRMSLADADSTKRPGWNVMFVDPDGKYRPAGTLDQLRAALGADRIGDRAFRAVVSPMRATPAWESAPAQLREEVEAWLSAE